MCIRDSSIASLEAAHYLLEDVTGVSVETLKGDRGLILTLTPLAVK